MQPGDRDRAPDGTRLAVLAHANPFHDESGELLGAVNILVDITERQRMEQAFRASEERLRAIVQATPECVKLVSADGTLLEMNQAGLSMIEVESARRPWDAASTT